MQEDELKQYRDRFREGVLDPSEVLSQSEFGLVSSHKVTGRKENGERVNVNHIFLGHNDFVGDHNLRQLECLRNKIENGDNRQCNIVSTFKAVLKQVAMKAYRLHEAEGATDHAGLAGATAAAAATMGSGVGGDNNSSNCVRGGACGDGGGAKGAVFSGSGGGGGGGDAADVTAECEGTLRLSPPLDKTSVTAEGTPVCGIGGGGGGNGEVVFGGRRSGDSTETEGAPSAEERASATAVATVPRAPMCPVEKIVPVAVDETRLEVRAAHAPGRSCVPNK